MHILVKVVLRKNVEVDGVPRYVLDISHLCVDQEESSGDEDDAVLSEELPKLAVTPQPRRSNREIPSSRFTRITHKISISHCLHEIRE
ncbi:hypothetical protein SK128_017774 [Halocaridina rubra]|uniref:Uncharacterized protein n=1 Tax=Halocaridina rubra TaxID=373956 RepID=A0AAN9AGN6_HALRR